MWFGVSGQIGARLDVGDELTSGICVAGGAYPVNDIYGGGECKYHDPDCVFATSLTGSQFFITTAAKEKDIPTLLSFFDYFYTEEGARLASLGLSAEQVKESGDEFYTKWGLEDGAYSMTDDGRYVLSEALQNDPGNLTLACRVAQIPSLTLIKNVDLGYSGIYETSLKSWIKYPNEGFFMGTAVTNNMSESDSKVLGDLRTKIVEYMTGKAPEMIRGITDPYNDTDWENWCKILQKYNYQQVTELCQPYLDQYSFK
jgi:hypothetical protein